MGHPPSKQTQRATFVWTARRLDAIWTSVFTIEAQVHRQARIRRKYESDVTGGEKITGPCCRNEVYSAEGESLEGGRRLVWGWRLADFVCAKAAMREVEGMAMVNGKGISYLLREYLRCCWLFWRIITRRKNTRWVGERKCQVHDICYLLQQ